MIYIFFAAVGFIITAPVLAATAFGICKWRRSGDMKCFVEFFILGIALNALLVEAGSAYLVHSSCDFMENSSPAINSRGDKAQAQLEACKMVGSFENYSIRLQAHVSWPFWPSETLIEYAPQGDDEPVLSWLDDDTLSVDLGRVVWVSHALEHVGNTHIRYNYILIGSPQH